MQKHTATDLAPTVVLLKRGNKQVSLGAKERVLEYLLWHNNMSRDCGD